MSRVGLERRSVVSRVDKILTINMTAARRIGLTAPPSVLVRADRVID